MPVRCLSCNKFEFEGKSLKESFKEQSDFHFNSNLFYLCGILFQLIINFDSSKLRFKHTLWMLPLFVRISYEVLGRKMFSKQMKKNLNGNIKTIILSSPTFFC